MISAHESIVIPYHKPSLGLVHAFRLVPQRHKERSLRIGQLTRRTLQVDIDSVRCHRMHQEVADLATVAMDPQVPDAKAFNQVIDLQLCSFFPTQTVVKQYGEDRSIA